MLSGDWGMRKSVTLALEAGIAGHVWSIEELVSIMPEPVAKKRGPYKKRAA
jgi:hypothetical protein